MLAFLKFGWIKGLIVAALLTTISGVIYGGYSYVTRLQTEIVRVATDNATLTVNNTSLEQAISEQSVAIDKLQADFALQTEIVNSTNLNFEQARAQVTALRSRLSKHELGFLAANRPASIENIINNATENVQRCFEIAAGSPLTDAERSAILPSKINTECPAIANPNYRSNK
jgi:hypothetical protein